MTASGRPERRRRIVALAMVVLVAGLVVVANLPVTTKQGINYEVSTHRLPLYVKGIEFVDRDVQYRELAASVTRGLSSDQERVLATYGWTVRNIRPTPDGWPIVDDHILNIIIRGYGMSDQRADVFAMLATYAGVPAFWTTVKVPGTADSLILSFARVDGRWVVFDVANALVFRNARGDLATAEELAAEPALLPAETRALTVGSTAYPVVFHGLRTPPAPRPLRAELQMLWPRIWHETRRAAGLGHDDGLER